MGNGVGKVVHSIISLWLLHTNAISQFCFLFCYQGGHHPSRLPSNRLPRIAIQESIIIGTFLVQKEIQ